MRLLKLGILSLLIFSGVGIFYVVSASPAAWQSPTGGGPGDLLGDMVIPGADDVLLGEITLGQPAADAIILNGASYVLAEGDALSDFGSDYYVLNETGVAGAEFEATDGLLLSTNNAVIDSADTVVTAGPLKSFPAVPPNTGASNGNIAIGWIDNVTGNVEYDATEDFFNVIANGDQVSDGDLIRAFTTSEIRYTNDSEYIFIHVADPGGLESDGDSVVIGGAFSPLTLLDGSDSVCFDASVSPDAEYDLGEVIWWDAAGDCTTFSTGVDVILVGGAAPAGASTEFGAESEIAYLDFDEDGLYTCSRTTCELVFYSGANGVNFTSGNIPNGALYFDSSTEATDGLSVIGTGWDELAYALGYAASVEGIEIDGELLYAYADTNGSTTFDETDAPILIRAQGGTDIATGQTMRLFYDNDYWFMGQSDNWSYLTTENPLIRSTDGTLDVGALDGTGTDEVIRDGNQDLDDLEGIFLKNYRYYDHDDSGSYEDGDDIVDDIDDSLYYNADDLLAVTFDASAGSFNFEDADLDNVRIYAMTGGACEGEGVDTLVGSDVASPFLGEEIVITLDSYTRSSSADSRTLCVYADIADIAGPGTYLEPSFNPSTFSSGVIASNPFTGGDNYFSVVGDPSVQFTPVNNDPGEVTDYTITFTTEVVIPADSGFFIWFPAEFDVAAAAATCSDDGGDLGGGSAIFFGIIAYQGADEIAADTEVTCIVTDVENPAVEDVYTIQAFVVGAAEARYYRDQSATITIQSEDAPAPSSGGGRRKPQPTYEFSVLYPVGGERFAPEQEINVQWQDAGIATVDFVSIYTSVNGGEDWTLVKGSIVDDGEELVILPGVNSEEALVRVIGVDYTGELASASDDSAEFTIGDAGEGVKETCAQPYVERENTCLTENVCVGDYVRAFDHPAVFYIGQDHKRHVFIREPMFFSYKKNYESLKRVTVEELSRIPEGKSMLVNAGSILVKMEDERVFYSQETNDPYCHELVWVPTEESAINQFGVDWSEKVLDLPAGSQVGYIDNGRKTTDSDFVQRYEKLFKRSDLRVRP